MSLGATEMSVEHVIGWERDFSANLTVPVLQTVSNVSASAGSEKKQSSSLLFTAKLANKAAPSIPVGLVWYPHEPTWQAVANGRITYGLTDFSLTVRYEDDFAVNAGLKLAAGKAGLDLGGKFEDHVATVWRISGTFASASNASTPAGDVTSAANATSSAIAAPTIVSTPERPARSRKKKGA